MLDPRLDEPLQTDCSKGGIESLVDSNSKETEEQCARGRERERASIALTDLQEIDEWRSRDREMNRGVDIAAYFHGWWQRAIVPSRAFMGYLRGGGFLRAKISTPNGIKRPFSLGHISRHVCACPSDRCVALRPPKGKENADWKRSSVRGQTAQSLHGGSSTPLGILSYLPV